MYAAYYGLEEPPFNITPDPRFLYLNDSYQEALAALAYGIEARKGFISLIGEAGTGKTTLLRRLLDTLNANVKTVLLLNPTVSFDEILEYILVELGIPSDAAGKLERLHRLNEFLIEHARAGGNVALLIDEAQDLGAAVLEELRLLSNLETAREKILQIVLAGQPELDAKMADPSLRQLRQRITLHVRLHPLSPDDVGAYVRTRLERAGARDPDLFTSPAVERVAIVTRGIPRIVNVVCDAALLTAFATGAKQVTPTVVEEVWREYAPPNDDTPPPLGSVTISAGVPSAGPVMAAVAAAAVTAETAVASVPPLPAPPTPAPEIPAPEMPAPAANASGTPPVATVAPTALPVVAASHPAVEAAPERHGLRDFLAEAATAGAPRAGRQTLSIPAAAGFVALLAFGFYGIAFFQHDDAPPAVIATVGSPMAANASGDTPPVAPVPVAPVAPVAVAAPITPIAAVAPVADPVHAAPTRDAPVSTEDAAALVDEFRTAYQARDVPRLVRLFAADASENGTRGVEAIEAAYRRTFGALEDLRYRLPSISIAPQGSTTRVRAPFVISYREPTGDRRELHGEAEWEVERRDGRPLITALTYRLDPES